MIILLSENVRKAKTIQYSRNLCFGGTLAARRKRRIWSYNLFNSTIAQYTEARYLEIKFHKKIRILIASSSSSPLSFALVFIVRTLVLQKNKKLNRLEHKILIAINTIIIFIFIIPGIALFHV